MSFEQIHVILCITEANTYVKELEKRLDRIESEKLELVKVSIKNLKQSRFLPVALSSSNFGSKCK